MPCFPAVAQEIEWAVPHWWNGCGNLDEEKSITEVYHVVSLTSWGGVGNSYLIISFTDMNKTN